MEKTVIKLSKKATRNQEELIAAAKAKDAKMDRSRKTPTKEQKAAALVNDMINYSAPVPEYILKVFEEPKEEVVEWDVKIGDPIEFFDPLLSYELTGYRPLDLTHSLDFDPTVFTVAAQTYRRTGRYTQLIPGTFKHRNHWIEEFKRCKEGYTVGKYRITGEHYFFLNYFRLLSVLGDGKGGEVQSEDFPAFMAKQYEMFHYIELARLTGHDALVFKCRGVGFSLAIASIVAHGYTFHKASKSIVSAFAQNYVDATLGKTWQELDFLNTGTEGGFRRVRMKVDTAMKKRASKVDTDKNETGWMSEIEGIVTDNPRKLRGARVYTLCIDEAGSFPGLIDTYVQARALVDILGYRVGMRLLGGCVCAGTKVWTNKGEYKNIEDLVQEDGIIGFKDGSANKEPIVYMQPPTEKECVEITFSDGTKLRCSEDHPILIRKQHSPRDAQNREKRNRYFTWEFVEAGKLMSLPGYKIAGQCLTIDIFGTETLFDPYLVGLLIGDGSYGYDKTPRLANCDKVVLDYVKSKYDWAIDRPVRLTKDWKQYEEIRIKGIVPELRAIGIYGQVKTNKRLPNNYQLLSKNDAAQLLAGLFDTDGYINHKAHQIELCQSSRDLLELVLILLYKFGIYSTLRRKEPNIKEGRKAKNPWYILTINDIDSYNNFADSIPVKIDYKRIVGHAPHKDNHARTPGIREVAIRSVEKIGRLPIYNLTAGDSHTYLANNVITHNTGGDSGPNLEGLHKMFYNPEEYQILPYKNSYSSNGQISYTGFFIPSFTMWFGTKGNPGFDNRGVVDELRAKDYYNARWEKMKDPHLLLKDRAEYCFTPEDAFVLEGDNRFDLDLLVEQYNNIVIHKTISGPLSARLSWVSTDDEGHIDKSVRPKIEFVSDSPLKVLEMPKLDSDGCVFKNLYLIGCDSIDSDSTTSTGQTDVSKFCVIVYRRAFGLESPKIVATYIERPQHISTAFDNALKLALFYNALMLFEASRVSIKHYFEKEHMLHLLMRRPSETSNRTTRTNLKLYGVPATQAIIDHQLDLIEQYIVDYCEEILFPELLDELIRYSYANKRKFDMVAAFAMCLLADESMMGKTVRAMSLSKENIINLSYYKNEYGQIEFGVQSLRNPLIGFARGEDQTNDLLALW